MSKIVHCNYCGANIVGEKEKCPYCNKKITIDSESTKQELPSALTETIVSKSSKRSCKKCGYELEEDWIYCPNCSFSLNSQEVTSNKVDNDSWIYIIFYFVLVFLWLIHIYKWRFLLLIALGDIVLAKVKSPKNVAINILFTISMCIFSVVAAFLIIRLGFYWYVHR